MKSLFVPLVAVLTVVAYADLPLAPLEPLAPRFPLQVEEQEMAIFRGQDRAVDELSGILGSQPPLAQGSVDAGAIDPKLIGPIDSFEPDFDAAAARLVESNPTQASPTGQETKPSDPLGYTVLLIATTVTTIGLIYMAFVAYDYRQRWMQSLTMQNDRYLVGGTFDRESVGEPHGTYGGSPSFPG